MPHWRKALTNPGDNGLAGPVVRCNDQRALRVHVSGLVCETI